MPPTAVSGCRAVAQSERPGRPARPPRPPPRSPMTHPIRNGRDERERFGESRMKIVAMIGTELRATATANGRMWPIACTSLLSRR